MDISIGLFIISIDHVYLYKQYRNTLETEEAGAALRKAQKEMKQQVDRETKKVEE